MSSERVRVSIRNRVADVQLARPDKMNAIDGAMFRDLVETGRELRDRRDLRAVVLSGAGRAFCAGLDFANFAALAGKRSGDAPNLFAHNDESPANAAQRAAWIWNEIPVPVIAAVHGVAYGGGLQIALAADIRIVAPDARLSVMEIKWGLIPDMSGTQSLRHLVRLDVAKELTFTGRVVSGREAVELGLATQMSDTPLETALEMAEQIAGRSPCAMRAGKRLLDGSVRLDLVAGLQLEAELQASLIGRPNQIEAVQANLEKRDPHFDDPEA